MSLVVKFGALAFVLGMNTQNAINLQLLGATVHHFASSTAHIPGTTQSVYIGVTALVLNLAVAVVLTVLLIPWRSSAGVDITEADDYVVEAGEVPPLPTLDTAVQEEEVAASWAATQAADMRRPGRDAEGPDI